MTILKDVIQDCSTWGEYQKALSSEGTKIKGDAFEHLVKVYLQIEPKYASKLSHVWLLNEIPADVSRKLKLPATDQGIDLVAKTHDGEFWAIQCKYREDSTHALTWREVSTFTGLAFGICEGFSFGLICATVERSTRIFKDQERIAFCSLDVWQDLNADFFARAAALQKGAFKRPDPAKPRPHQKNALKDCISYFSDASNRRGKLIMPCGTGKSLTSFWMAKSLKAQTIIVAVPSLALIRQTLKVWLSESIASNMKVNWICVCSDETLLNEKSDDTSVLKQDLGIPCITDDKEISQWLKKTKKGMTVVFTTYQSGKTLARAAGKRSFDLGIMDESHKTVGDKAGLFSHLLFEKNISIRRRIFMTATERRYIGQSDEIASMDNVDIYGETFHLLTFREAMECNPPILSDYRIITMAISSDEIDELIKSNALVRPNDKRMSQEMETQQLACLVALRKAMLQYPIRHAVSFHSSIQRAESFKHVNDLFSESFSAYGKPETFHVSGNTPAAIRDITIKRFAKSSNAIITNARCLTEGVDVPDIDCVLFADPRRSAVDIVQAVGRALRLSKGKDYGYVIIPIVHNGKGDPFLESDQFAEVLATLRALAANDDRIIEFFRSISQGKKSASGNLVQFNVEEKLASKIDLDHFVREVELKCWDKLAKISWRPFEEARSFVRKLGLKNRDEWFKYIQGEIASLPPEPDLPTNPYLVYCTSGWKGMGDWLGTGRVATHLREYLPYEEAKRFPHSLRLKNTKAWRTYTKTHQLPSNIPANPNKVYRNSGWKGFSDWLGNGVVSNWDREFLPFSKARAFVRSLELKSRAEWNLYTKGKIPKLGAFPENLPVSPERKYKDSGWLGMGDWLGTGNVANFQKVFLPFNEAREFVQSLDLKSLNEWCSYCVGKMPNKGIKPLDIPTNPSKTYANEGWVNMGDWLGTGTIATYDKVYRSFCEARKFAHQLQLKSNMEWRAYCKGEIPSKKPKPSDISSSPDKSYKGKGWKSWGDWLGTNSISNSQRGFLDFESARIFVRSLRLKNRAEWRLYAKGKLRKCGIRPKNIPSTPEREYMHSGWKNMSDWLGIHRAK